MNKLLYVLLATSVIFSACQKEEDNNNPPVNLPSLQVSGDTLINGNASSMLTSYLTVVNVSNNTIDVGCRINIISQDPGTTVQFCWGEACYPQGVLVAGNTVSMSADQVVVYPDSPAHSGYYDANDDKNAIAQVEYCFYDNANPTDETCFTVTFDPSVSK